MPIFMVILTVCFMSLLALCMLMARTLKQATKAFYELVAENENIKHHLHIQGVKHEVWVKEFTRVCRLNDVYRDAYEEARTELEKKNGTN